MVSGDFTVHYGEWPVSLPEWYMSDCGSEVFRGDGN